MKQYAMYCDAEERVVTTSFSYEMPEGAIIRGNKKTDVTERVIEDITEDVTTEDVTTEDVTTEDVTTEKMTEDVTTEKMTVKDIATEKESLTEKIPPVSKPTSDSSTTTDSQPTKTTDMSTTATTATTTNIDIESTTTTTEKKSGPNVLVIVLSVLAASLVTIIALAVAFFIHKRRQKRITNQQQEQTWQPTVDFERSFVYSPDSYEGMGSGGKTREESLGGETVGRGDHEVQRMEDISELGTHRY